MATTAYPMMAPCHQPTPLAVACGRQTDSSICTICWLLIANHIAGSVDGHYNFLHKQCFVIPALCTRIDGTLQVLQKSMIGNPADIQHLAKMTMGFFFWSTVGDLHFCVHEKPYMNKNIAEINYWSSKQSTFTTPWASIFRKNDHRILLLVKFRGLHFLCP